MNLSGLLDSSIFFNSFLPTPGAPENNFEVYLLNSVCKIPSGKVTICMSNSISCHKILKIKINLKLSGLQCTIWTLDHQVLMHFLPFLPNYNL